MDLVVRSSQVHEVERVREHASRRDREFCAPLLEPLEVRRIVVRRAPHTWALREQLHGVCTHRLRAVERRVDAAGGRHVGAEEHPTTIGGSRGRPCSHGAVADRVPARRHRAHVPLQLAVRAPAGRRVPAADREHRHQSRGRRRHRADPAFAVVARYRLGRAGDVPARPAGRVRGVRAATARVRARLRGRGAMRFRMPEEGETGWEDVIRGKIDVPNASIEDLVLVRGDGRPTYNFASPVEDMLDGITHVIRSAEHISNTPKQIQILRALGVEPPRYAHVPIVLGPDGKKLSKRHGAESVDDFRREGYVAPALMNFLARLGWAADDHTEVFSRDELLRLFRLERVSPSPGVFDHQKLNWLNGKYLRAMPPGEYADTLLTWLREQGYDWDDELVRR